MDIKDLKLANLFGANEATLTKNMNRFLDQGEWSKAAEQCTKLVYQFHSSNANLRLKLAEICLKAGQKEKSLMEYQEAGERFVLEGNFAKAISVYRTILNIDPRLPQVKVKLVEVYLAQGEKEEAWKQGIEAVKYLETGKLADQAVATLERLASLPFNDTVKYFKIAEMLRVRNQPEKAKNQFLNTAEISLQNRDARVAYQAFKRVLMIEPENLEAKKGLELVQCLVQEQKKAQEILENQSKKAEEQNLALIYPYPELWENFSEERLDEILEKIAAQEDDTTKTAHDHYHIGLVYLEMKLLDAAVTEFLIAAKDTAIAQNCYGMLKNCYESKGMSRLAAEYQQKIANAPVK